jgi:hypothetical protein
MTLKTLGALRSIAIAHANKKARAACFFSVTKQDVKKSPASFYYRAIG